MEDRFVDAGKGGFEGEVQAEAGGHREGEWVGCEAGREVQLITRPNWARKVREMILLSVLCTVHCRRGCMSLESE